MDNSEELDRLREQLLISKHELDKEVSRQPVLYQEVAEQVAVTTSYRDAAKKRLAETEASVARKIRLIHRESKTRFTDRQVQDEIVGTVTYIKAYKRFLRYKLLTSRWEALRNAYEQRAMMLRTMAQLYSAQYYSSGSISEQAASGRQAMTHARQRRKEKGNEKESSKRKERPSKPW